MVDFKARELIQGLRDQIANLAGDIGALSTRTSSNSSHLTIGSGPPGGGTPTSPPYYWDSTDKNLYVYDGDWNIH